MATKITDKRGRNQELLKAIPELPSTSLPGSSPIVQANADGSLKEVEKTEPEVLLLTPFSDGTCLKMLARPWPSEARGKPADYDQHPQFVLLNAAKQQLAVTKNQQVAELICDAVNILFAAQEEHDRIARATEQEAKSLTDSIISANFKNEKASNQS